MLIDNRSVVLFYHITAVLGLILGIISYVKKEQNDYKKIIGSIGNLISVLILSIMNLLIFEFIGYV